MQGADLRILPGPNGLTGPRLLAALLLGCATGLLFGSHPLAIWAEKLPEPWSPLRTAAQAWDATMTSAGLARPYETIHTQTRSLVPGS